MCRATTIFKMLSIGAVLMTAVPAFADDAHHPSGTENGATSDSVAPGGQPGMNSGGMMSANMMNMMSSMMGSMMAPEHVEGRIAFLKTELKITDSQQGLWDTFAEALRHSAQANAGMMRDMQSAMMPSQGATADVLLQRLDTQERILTAHLESLRAMKAALQPLYATFDEPQKRAADELLMPGTMGHM
jgi:hypothetical protein